MELNELKTLALSTPSYIIVSEGMDYIEVADKTLGYPYTIWTTEGLTSHITSLMHISKNCEETCCISKAELTMALLTNLKTTDMCVLGGVFFYWDEADFDWLRKVYDDNAVNCVNAVKDKESAYLGEYNLIYVNARKLFRECKNDASFLTRLMLHILQGLYKENRMLNFISDNPVYQFSTILSEKQEDAQSKNYAEAIVSSPAFMETINEVLAA